jgi:hypothetical protein
MGLGSSKQQSVLRDVEVYAAKAKSAAELSNLLLTSFFTQVDFHDLLSLSSISACSNYVFLTSQTLSHIFDKIQIEPRAGPEGEILFVPLRRLIPFEEKGRPATEELRERFKQRNQMCINVAYMYVRMFQIYAALALTVLDTYPGRRILMSQAVLPRAQQQGPRSPLFFGGGSKPILAPLGTMVGGALSATMIRTLKTKGPFFAIAPVLKKKRSMDVFEFDDSRGDKEGTLTFTLKDVQGSERDATSYINATWVPKVGRNIQIRLKVERKEDDPNGYLLFIDTVRDAIGEFESAPNADASRLVEPQDLTEFYEGLEEVIYSLKPDSSATRKPSSASSSSSSSSSSSASAAAASAAAARSGPSVLSGSTAGKTYFQGFDPIKKLYDDKFAGKEFPKAFCTARAMQLMTPLFPSELPYPNAPFQTQFCRRSFDFETSGEYLPRAGKTPSANIYYRSLVSLYYDDYQVRGDQISALQSAEGKAELQQASKKIASLYSIPTNQETFLESQVQFKAFRTCTNDSMYRFVDPSYRVEFFQKFIQPMLDFQEQHSKRVDAMLMKMFQVKQTPGSLPMILFSPLLKVGGKAQLHAFCQEARRMLLDYYLRSDAMFIQAVIQLEKVASNPLILLS